MVLSSLGLDLSESQLRQLADCSPFGTDAFQIVEAARTLGFRSSRKYTLGSVDDLRDLIVQGCYPIVYIDLWPIKGGLSGQYHSLVVISVDPDHLIVLDPLVGETTITRLDFDAAWSQTHRLAILITA
jgi:ABC-type bacteriocin/lantibiotic exporter with double-glycine peptidase domain